MRPEANTYFKAPELCLVALIDQIAPGDNGFGE